MRIKHFAAALALLIAAVSTAQASSEYADAVSRITAPPRSERSVGARAVSVWDGTSTEKPKDGPTIMIENAAQLAWLAQNDIAKEFGNSTAVQITTDIDLGGHQWTPIPSQNIQNISEIDGGGHIIKGLKITGERSSNVGLFGGIKDRVQDLHLAGVDIDVTITGAAAVSHVGAIAGTISGVDGAQVEGCTVQGSITVRSGAGASDTCAGGLIGKTEGATNMTFEHCSVNASIRNESSGISSATGGLAGNVVDSGTDIRSCVSAGSIYANSTCAGGLIGRAGERSTFRASVNRASVTLVSKLAATNNNVAFGAGGLLGVAHVTANRVDSVEIESCVNYGTIKLEGTAGADSADLAGGSGGLIGSILNAAETNVSKSMNAGAVSNSASTGTMGGSGKMYRGTGGLIGVTRFMGTGDDGELDIEMSRNTAAVSSENAAPAGGVIGTISVQSNMTTPGSRFNAKTTSSYNSGAVSNSRGEAGGVAGRIEETAGGILAPQAELTLERSYSSVVPTGTYAGGAVGYANFENLVNAGTGGDTTFSHPKGVYLVGRDPTGTPTDVTCQKDMSQPTSYQSQGRFWDDFDDTGAMPPAHKRDDFDHLSGVTITNAETIQSPDGSVYLRLAELPDAAVRDASPAATYSISEYDPSQSAGQVITVTPIASGLKIDASGRLTVPAAQAASLKEGMLISIKSENDPDARGIEYLSVMYGTEASVGEISAVAVRGTPLTPEERTTKQLYIEWTDANGAVHSEDRPLDMPSVEWSVVSPAGPNWQVDVEPTAGDPFRASLTIGAPKSASTVMQEYAVRVVVSNGTVSEDIVYTRKFFAGSFHTKVTVSPEDAEMIDAANSVLARTRVSILPGNFQPVMPAHLLRELERRLAAGLNTYATDAAVRAAADEHVEVLADMDMIRSMMVERPVEESLPICFKTTEKHSANIELDLTERPEIAGSVVMLPMTYSVTFHADEMKSFFGDDAEAILAAPTSQASLAKIFDVLVLHKRIKEGAMKDWYTRLVSGVSTPEDALRGGMLQIEANDGELAVRLAYNVINFAGESFVISGPFTEGDDDTVGYIILPDGERNDKLIDPLWSNLWIRSQPGSASGGGGGCAAGAAATAVIALAATRKRNR